MARQSTKYEPLRRYLAALPGERVTLRFAEVEAIVGAPLPASAGGQHWWTNYPRPARLRGWGAAGWRVAHVDAFQRLVTFVRVPPDSTA
jgi:hypothetical protein